MIPLKTIMRKPYIRIYKSASCVISGVPNIQQSFPSGTQYDTFNLLPYDPRLPSPCPAFQKRARSDGTLQLLSARSYFFAVFYCNTAVGVRLSDYNQFPAPYLDDLS